MSGERCCGRLWAAVRALLQTASIGKYNHGFYFRRKSHQSSALGGLATLLFGCILLAFSLLIFADIVARTEYTLTQTEVQLAEDKEVRGVTVGDFLSETLRLKGFQMFLDTNLGYLACANVSVRFAYVDLTHEPLLSEELVFKGGPGGSSLTCNVNLTTSGQFQAFYQQVKDFKILDLTGKIQPEPMHMITLKVYIQSKLP